MKENNLEGIWEYVEPHPSGGTCYVRMTKQQAIDWTREIYSKLHPENKMNDEELFQEWVVVNWAYKYEKEK